MKSTFTLLFVSKQLAVRGITCISENIYHLRKLKVCFFNNDFKVGLQNLLRLCLKLFRPRSKFLAKKI